MTWLAERLLLWLGWRFEGELPDLDKMILVGGPHTSNWDFILYLAAVRHWRITPRFMGKHTLFRPPFGRIFRWLGGIPVDRSKPGGLVAEVAAAMESSDRMMLLIAPEGTRKAAPYWKSGFLTISRRTGAPIVPAVANYRAKVIRLGEPLRFEGDETALMDRIRGFFALGMGKNPEGMGPVKLESETDGS